MTWSRLPRQPTERGARAAWAPREETDAHGVYRTAAIHTYEVPHVFVDRRDYHGAFAPSYQPLTLNADSAGLAAIDHIVGNVELGMMNYSGQFLPQAMGFRLLQGFTDEQTSTEYLR